MKNNICSKKHIRNRKAEKRKQKHNSSNISKNITLQYIYAKSSSGTSFSSSSTPSRKSSFLA